MTTGTNVLVVTSWLAAALFTVRYLFTRWFTRTAGVLVMVFVCSAFAVLSLAMLTTFLGTDWPFREPVRLVIYVIVNILLWSGLRLLVRDQRGAGRHHL